MVFSKYLSIITSRAKTIKPPLHPLAVPKDAPKLLKSIILNVPLKYMFSTYSRLIWVSVGESLLVFGIVEGTTFWVHGTGNF